MLSQDSIVALPHLSLPRKFSPALPYLAVGLGLYFFHNAFLSMGLYHLGMVIALWRESRWDEMRKLRRGFNPWLLAGSVVLCLVGGGFTYFCWPWVGMPGLGEQLGAFGLTPRLLPWFFLYFTIINPVLEEPFWRGYHGSTSNRPIWHDLWFAGYHVFVLAFFMRWYWLPLVLFGLAFMSWIWRLLAQRLDGLLINVISHVAADAGAVVAVLLLVT